jgi:type II secretory pathway pseudopilin PulG
MMRRSLPGLSPLPAAYASAGFSLSEVVVSAVILVASALGLFSLASMEINQSRRAQAGQEERAAIVDDLSLILQVNDRYSCYSGVCTAGSGIAAPSEKQYSPASSVSDIDFRSLCNPPSLSSPSLVDPLLVEIRGLARGSKLVALGITREVGKDSQDVLPLAHRYHVLWKNQDNKLLRQITLSPTVAAWCPR